MYTENELMEARRQIDSTLHKLREVIRTLEAKENPSRFKSQITLAQRRVQAFEIANSLIASQLEMLAKEQEHVAVSKMRQSVQGRESEPLLRGEAQNDG